MPRFWEIDALRGIAIIMMIIFHFLWDLKYFDFIDFDIYSGFWGAFQMATLALFLLIAGIVLPIGANKHKNYPIHFLKRGLFVFGAGLVLTLASFVLFPSELIFFGVLHLIGVSIILSIPFARKKFIPLVLGAVLIILPIIFNLQNIGINYLNWVGLALPPSTLDFTPIIPWFGVILIGIFFGNLFYPKAKRVFSFPENNNWFAKKLQFLGKHSLIIYLIHQPIIFGIVFLATLI